MRGGSITTEGVDAAGVYAYRTVTTDKIEIDVSGGDIVAAGLNAVGMRGWHTGRGSVELKTGADATVAAPFAVGMRARVNNNMNAAGRLVVTHGGEIEAREVGVLAHAERSSGHTMGAGAQTANDAARTDPMIHITSTGTVTVGASVTEAFIRSRIAGDDGALSSGEQAVLDAVTAEDSSALDTALAALPASYDAAWKTAARSLLAKRTASSAAPTGAEALANRAAAEILGLSRAGVRAIALSHTAIANHVRAGNALSAEERTVLDAVLTAGSGSALETALTALSGGAYTTAWKNGVRQRALTYNAGDIRVEVKGGSITAEGNGVEALYAVPHDSNGAVAVSVAEGAQVTGDANGIYVRNAGADGSLRAQSVTVNGAAMGGTGAGVFMVGGGRLVVGETGRVGATSGDGVLSDGAGDLLATVKGTVEGDIRVRGGGALRLDVREGGEVTGTAHDPAGPLTVAGSIGRVLYSSGGVVTVTRTGALTGVEGESLRSESGDLRLTVSGRVAGDLRAPRGGKLNLAVQEGGTVTGTVHDPVGPLTVAGSIGRLLYTSGGTVTVTRTGALTGVEVDGKTESIRSESGDLNLTVSGRVAGDLRAPRGGKLNLAVQEGGTVTGTAHDPVGPLTVAGGIGRLLYSSGGTVTVTRTGALTGVEVDGKTESIRSESGDLRLTVSGSVAGDVRARGGGKLTLDVKEGGTVTGTVRDPAGPLTVAGSVGRLLYSSGGMVTVAGTGRLAGVDGVALRSEAGNLDLTVAAMGAVTGDIDARGDGDLKVMVSGTVDGDIFGRGAGEHTVTVARGGSISGTVDLGASAVTTDGVVGRVLLRRGGETTVGATGRLTGVEVGGRTEALRSEAGDLSVTVAGMAVGDIVALGDGAHEVTVALGGRAPGTIDLGGAGTVTVNGLAGRVSFARNGAVTVGPKGRIPGVDDVAVDSRSGAPAVTIVVAAGESPEDARKRVGEVRAAEGEASIRCRREGETETFRCEGETGSPMPGPDPKTRVYEALPSLLLGMERPASHAERMAAPRAPNGAWARVDASRGSWEAASSTGAGLEYDRRGFSFRAGVDAALGEETRGSASVHVRRATAEVSRNGGEIEVRGAGVGVSATWSSGPLYVDGQASATLYDVDLKTPERGVLKDDARAHVLSAALEAGRAVPVADGVTVTPRARMAWSSLSLPEFEDSAGSRVSLDHGRSLTGRAGALAERAFGDSRIFGSLDVEHEFEAETRMSVAGMSLATSGEETRYLAGVGAGHAWEDGRFMLRAALGYAATGGGETHDYGGRASLSMRF